MPELPEMETYREFLHHNLLHKPITNVEIHREKSINQPVQTFKDAVLGKHITSVKRRAKHLIFELSTGNYLLLHLMLGGLMFFGNANNSPDRTKQIILSFGELQLNFIGLRLGYLHLLKKEELDEKLQDLGPEPLQLTFGHFENLIQTKKGSLKPLLVDQKFISGIGNCYSDEICFQAKLDPFRKAGELSVTEIKHLYESIKPVLTRAIQYGGYMDFPMYEGDVKTGGYNSNTLVYEREGENCNRCGAEIKRAESKTIKSFHCPNCQK
ncbi:formamidopyrimidine-DNA glycosylase [Fictibacillus phosphorivorans]|uniref:Formamidopyrimidine-DNA glycosylase n=1 Tax=Fictibacillus phosphorivorans TaxID=1221500 RepID=A0A163R4P5_9BACL|nr:DNA-formamidopyrimidine glycosylase [Fictibacillus phosphorivorans]KZE66186.1 formamidopyrimidine-DNA glycosylase [Fictibacillus phosphorivorans]